MSSSSAAAASSSASTAAGASVPVAAVDPTVDVDSFLRDLTTLERETEVARITKHAFKLNPFDVLNVSHAATKEEIAKAYRAASLQVHPDKFPVGAQRDAAQTAFTMLAAAKEELLDETKRETLDALVDKARQKVLTDKAAEGRTKKRKTGDANDAAAAASAASEEAVDASEDPLFDSWVRAEVKELIIEREWRKRQLLKAAAEAEALAAKEKAERATQRAEKEAETKAWEAGRDSRINSWRDFQAGGKKKRMAGMLSMPKAQTKDTEQTFIRRPVTSSEK